MKHLYIVAFIALFCVTRASAVELDTFMTFTEFVAKCAPNSQSKGCPNSILKIVNCCGTIAIAATSNGKDLSMGPLLSCDCCKLL